MPEPNTAPQNGKAVTTENNDVEESDDDSLGFAVSVDLSACVGEGARCRVWVRRGRGRRVRWLAARVRRAARLRGPFLLRAHADLLPPGEPLRLLRSSDTVRVERIENEWQRPFCFIDDSDNSEDRPAEPAGKKTRKRRADPQLSPSNISPPTQQLCPVEYTSSPLVLQSTPDDSMQMQRHTFEVPAAAPDPSSVTNEALLRVKQRALALLQQVAGEEEGRDDVDAPKKRRRRVRRRRPRPVSPFAAPEPISDITESAPIESVVPPTQSLTPLSATPLSETCPTSPQTSALNPSSLTAPSESDTLSVTISATPSEWPFSDPLVSPLPSGSQTSEPALALSSSPLTLAMQPAPSSQPPQAVVTCPVWCAPAPACVRRTAAARAPRVVRALGAAPAASNTNATTCSGE